MKKINLLFIINIMFLDQTYSAELVKSPIIKGHYIRLGHLFENINNKEKENRVLSVSPKPGKIITLSAMWLSRIAKKNEIEWRAKTNEDYCMVKSAYESYDYKDITKILDESLSSKMEGQKFISEIDQKDIKIYFPSEQLGDIEISELRLVRNRSRFFANVKKIEHGKTTKTYRINGKITPIVSIPSVNKIIKQGEKIKIKDIHWIDVPTHFINSQTLTQENDLIGTTPRQGTIRENVPVKKSDIYRMLTIKKGEIVTLHAKTDYMQLSAKGKALENGLMGQAIKILNLGSNRTVHATVTGNKKVEVYIPTIQNLG